MTTKSKHLSSFQSLLGQSHIDTQLLETELVCTYGKKKLALPLNEHLDFILHQPTKLVALVQSKLGLNKTIFARSCELKKIEKKTAGEFLDNFHLMNSTQSAFNYGLFYKGELMSVASFSKGRKMNRLPEDKRSFELIRFCSRQGITVTGGLTKLVKNFCREKNAGDVMTYVDKQFSDGASFVKAGFTKHSETERNTKLVFTP